MPAETTAPYEPPSIEDRSAIALPLVAVVGSPVGTPSAVFRPTPDEAYEPPSVEARDLIGIPLIGGPATSGTISAAFRP